MGLEFNFHSDTYICRTATSILHNCCDNTCNAKYIVLHFNNVNFFNVNPEQTNDYVRIF